MHEQRANTLRAELGKLTRRRDETEQTYSEKRSELIVLEDELLLESFALYRPKFSFTNSTQFKERLDQIRD